MKVKNTKKLYSDFPELFQDGFMHERGFECEDGWFDLIYDLSSDLQKQHDVSELRVTQVKQKMGYLVYSVNNLTDDISVLITHTQNKAKEICELCGSEGSTLNVCKSHHIVLCKYCSSLGDNAYDCVPYEEYSNKINEKTNIYDE